MKLPRQISGSEKGQSFIELGASLVVLLLILVGVAEFGMFMFQYMAMRDAASEGAVFASMYPTACNQTIERIKRDLYNVDPAEIEVIVKVNGAICVQDHVNATDACAPNGVNVTIHQPNYPITMPFLGAVLGRQSFDISVTTTSTILRPSCH
jgi:Flp pilus assembly protein TadG